MFVVAVRVTITSAQALYCVHTVEGLRFMDPVGVLFVPLLLSESDDFVLAWFFELVKYGRQAVEGGWWTL